MRVSLDWLNDFITVKGDVNKVQHSLTMIGLEVTSILDIEDDKVMDIEVTPNRPDCLCILGIARELAAALNKPLKIPLSISKNIMKKGRGGGSVKIEVSNKKDCSRYIGCILKNVKLSPSPGWLVSRLNAMGVRSINNIVDITNYTLFETGQPLHAFDFDKLEGKKIIVRRAKNGEDIVTIDGVKRELDPSILVIADAKKPVAIAGIMGGKDTEIASDTKNILLESAYFEPNIIRKTQRKLGLASESSYRFERGVDPGMVLSASARAQELIREIASGRVSGKISDIGTKISVTKEILLSLDEIPRILGIEISSQKAIDFFKRLSLFAAKKGKGKVLVRTPSYRQDLERDIDLIEELARLYGYDKVPAKIPRFTIQKTYEEEKKESTNLEKEAKRILSSLGMNEIVTYTLTSRFSIEALGGSFDEVIRLKNPLSSNQEFMRASLASEMLEVISWNLNRGNTLIQLFELNKVYLKRSPGAEIQEKLNLCLGVGGTTSGNWKEKAREIDFFDLKGIMELFLTSLGIKPYAIDEGESFIFKEGMSSHIKIEGETIGAFGKVKPEIARKFDIKQNVYLAEIYLEGLLRHVNFQRRFTPLPRYPSIKRDVSMIIDDSVTSSNILEVLRQESKGLVKAIKVFDVYKGHQIQQGKKSLAYTLEYRSDEKTLKDEEVGQIHKNIQEVLVKKLGAEIR
ncbi:MAG: phenylalanine--tRNA ligase subunit beta [Candidatus Omnitrophica bacterium]|nr:phenylalanine--tRNA ligase subunit beta [Candidatus Omnitrophota bacterium]